MTPDRKLLWNKHIVWNKIFENILIGRRIRTSHFAEFIQFLKENSIQTKLKMCEDIHNCCRLCLDVESSHVSIFGDPTISLHLRSCLSLTVAQNDPLPTDICMSCVSQLSQFYHFQLNARCSQEWLESSFHEKSKKVVDKAFVQPLPDSEYNSDSLLEFLNNTANIDEYLNNLGKEDIPSIVNMLDKNEVIEACKLTAFKAIKQPSPKKKEKSKEMAMEIDVLDSDVEIVKEIIFKEAVPKPLKNERDFHTCYGCKIKFESIQKLCQHVSTCDSASRTCVQCDTLFDSRQKMIEHSVSHTFLPLTCNCKEQFSSKEKLIQHQKTCHNDNTGCTFRCKECGEVSKDRFQLYRHVRNHVIKEDEKKCEYCGHIFIGNEALEKHKKKEHDQSQGNMYRCKICHLTSASHQEMYLHVKEHTGTPTKLEPSRHLCESCGKSFSTNAILMRHSQQHKDFKCNVCDKSLKNLREKEAHILVHNDVVMCDRCGKTVKVYEIRGHTCL